MDGTLVDSTAVVEHLWSRFAEEYHLDLDEVLAYAHGRQSRDTIRAFLPDAENFDDVLQRFEDAELTETDGIVEIPGAHDLLTSLPGDRVAIVTSATRALAEHRLHTAGLPIPAVLVTAEDVTHGKPHPEGYALAARTLGVDPAECLAIEDARAGVVAAQAARTQTIIVGSLEAFDLPRVADLHRVTVHRHHDELVIHLNHE